MSNGYLNKENQIKIISEKMIKEDGVKVYSGDEFYVYKNNDNIIGVKLYKNISDTDSDIVLDILNDSYNDGCLISINDIKDFPEVDQSVNNNTRLNSMNDTKDLDEGMKNSRGLIYYYKNGKASKIGNQYQSSDKFALSVAKGQTVKLTRKITLSISLSVEAGAAFKLAEVKAGMKGSISSEYSISTKYTGPTKKGTNSREYRTRFYKQKYKRTQYKKNRFTGKTVAQKQIILGVPTKYANYSIDKKIK